MTSRSVTKTVYARETPEGVGVTVRRSIGSPELRNLSPFLMLDHATVSRGSGFAEHPHRGFSTISYILEGKIQHEDFRGHRGIIAPGGVQWMQAGRGILHSEIPFFENQDSPDPVGLQLWLDLPKANKLDEPNYQEWSADEMTVAHPSPNMTVKILSGSAPGSKSEGTVTAPTKTFGGCYYSDYQISAAGEIAFHPIPANWTAFAYVLEGRVQFGETQVDQHNTAVFSEASHEDGVAIKALSDKARFVLIAGEKLDQEIVQYGPFVMTSREEIQQAISDYQQSKNGFEGASEWISQSAKRLY